MWVKIDDHFPNHPKVVRAGGDAAWLYLCGLCYCAEHLTDGKIPAAMVPRLSDRKAPMKLARKLVDVGLWDGSETTGFVVHDWCDWNPSADEARKKRSAKPARSGRRSGGVPAARAMAAPMAAAKQTAIRLLTVLPCRLPMPAR
jgi:hypothetical protein